VSSSFFVRDLVTGRRAALGVLGGMLAGAAAIALPAPARAVEASGAKRGSRPLDFSNPIDNLYAFGKIWSGYERPVIGGFHGLMYLRMPGKRLLPVFGYTAPACCSRSSTRRAS